MQVKLSMTSTMPMLVHSAALASPLNPWAKQLKAANAKRTKTDEDREQIAKIEFMGSLYFDDEIGPYIPAENLLACLIEGGKISKQGKHVERAVVVTEPRIPLLYSGPRTMEGLWADPNFVDVRSVRVQQNRVDRCRPIFRSWAAETEVMVDPSVLDFSDFETIAHRAGQMSGLGDYRKIYGRFAVEVKQL